MTQHNKIQLFEEKKVRALWDDEQEKWYFSVVDVVEVLTDSVNPTDYIKKMRKRDPMLAEGWGQIVTPLAVDTVGGKQKTNFATMEGVLRIIQSIPSPKAEPFKQWMAQVAAQRLDQMQDPELSIEQAMMDYKRLGYSDAWINQRLKSIEIRKDLTDEWKRRGLKEGVQFATLTDIIYSTWSGMTAKEYKQFKGLKKENLRDNMTNRELVLNMLAELSTRDISESQNPETFAEHADVARQGGEIAFNARMELETKTGKAVVTSLNATEAMKLRKEQERKLLEESNDNK
jgi:prophage antirepressor-like protein